MSSSYIGRVLDNYRIIENLGISGMGFVFKAIHIKLDKIFALKMIAPSLAMNKDFIKRFETETRALAKLEDPNIVRIKPDETTELSVDLVLLQGKLALQVRPWGSVYLNNELKKATSDVRYEKSLPVNQYELKVVHPTLGRWLRNIVIEADKERNVAVDFSHTFEINITAVDESGRIHQAIVIIDDKSTGQNTPAALQLHSGVHRLSVRKDGYISVNGDKEIFVDSQAEKTYTIILKKID